MRLGGQGLRPNHGYRRYAVWLIAVRGRGNHAQCAARFVTEAKVDGVKFEATHNHIAKTKAIVETGIAVVGHVCLHPQAVGALGGLKVQGKDIATARKVVSEALALQEAGVFAIIFEAVPAKLSAYVSSKRCAASNNELTFASTVL